MVGSDLIGSVLAGCLPAAVAALQHLQGRLYLALNLARKLLTGSRHVQTDGMPEKCSIS